MNPRCPVCRHPMSRTKRGALVCVAGSVFNEPERVRAHLDAFDLPDPMSQGVIAFGSLAELALVQWSGIEPLGNTGDAMGQKRNLLRSINP